MNSIHLTTQLLVLREDVSVLLGHYSVLLFAKVIFANTTITDNHLGFPRYASGT